MVWVSTTGDRQAVRGGIREILHSQGWNHLWPHCFLNPNCKLFHGNVWKSLIWRHWKFPNEFIAVNLITMPFFFLFHGHTLWFVELVTWPGIEPRTQEWNPQILTTGQPGNSHHAILREKKKGESELVLAFFPRYYNYIDLSTHYPFSKVCQFVILIK